MRKMKILLEFADFISNINVESVDGVKFSRLNATISKDEFDFSEDDFRLLLSCGGEEKEVSLLHGLFLEYIQEKDPSLSSYIKKLSDIDEIFSELAGFEWDFQKAIEGYVADNYNPETFSNIPSIDEDDHDDIPGWADEDQERYDDLIDDLN